MTHEQRLDRLERIAKLIVRAGVRYRRDMHQLGDKLNILVDTQIKNDERFKQDEAAFQSRSAEYEKRFNRNEARFNRDEEKLAKLSQKTDEKFAELAELIRILTRGRNGNPQTDS